MARWQAWAVAAVVGGVMLGVLPASPANASDQAVTLPPMQLTVTADDVQRRIQQVQQVMAVSPGPLTLHYPQWIPGHHAPTGGINQIAGLVVSANGKPLPWRRDPLDMYAFQLDIPEGASRLEIGFDYLSPTASDQGRVAMTPNLLAIQWHRVLLYPKGADTQQLPVAATLCVPQGWLTASALRGTRRGDCQVYAPVSLTHRTASFFASATR